jgi:transaldolase
MKIFLDTAEIDEIRTAARWGVLDGVTTNPSLFATVGGSYDEVLTQIYQITPGPVSAEVVAEDVEGILREGRHFATLASNIVVKVPMSEAGLEAISRLASEGIRSNCTLIFSSNQGLLAAKAGGLPAVALRRPPRRHQRGRHERRPRARRNRRGLQP